MPGIENLPQTIVTAPGALRLARGLRLACGVTETAIVLIVAGSALAFGSVHPFAYRALWVACGLVGLLWTTRGLVARALRAYTGPRVFAFAPNGRSLHTEPGRDAEGWSFDLSRPLLPRAPLLWPGLAFALWVTLQLVPWRGQTLSTSATLRGLAFVVSFGLLHLAAATTLADAGARRRLRRFLAWFGFALSLFALVQLSLGWHAIYGLFVPREGGNPMGPFVNRNHFAGYLLLLLPTALALLARALWAYRSRTSAAHPARRRLIALGGPEGIDLVYAALPVLAMVAALLASISRGAILALVLSLAVVLLAGRRSSRIAMAGMVAAFVAMGLTWFGLERLGDRFAALPDNAPGRAQVWRASIERMDGRWLTGSGFNTFEVHLSRVPAWRLPANATPWPDGVRAAFESGARVGHRYEGSDWYREAHNDYVQVLVETGLPGLAIALWAAWSVLRRTASHRWVFGALLAMLLHALVEFDFQIPALPALFVVLAGWRR